MGLRSGKGIGGKVAREGKISKGFRCKSRQVAARNDVNRRFGYLRHNSRQRTVNHEARGEETEDGLSGAGDRLW